MGFKKIKGIFGAAIILLISLVISGCGGGDDEPTTPLPPPPPLGELVTIDINPVLVPVIEDLAIQLTANGNFSSGKTVEITEYVSWSSSDNTVATIGANNGLVAPVSQGEVIITATKLANDGVTEISATVTLTVDATSLTSITVTPLTLDIPVGVSQAFIAMGNYDNGSSVDLTASVTWGSSDDAIATVDASGLSTSIAVGTVTITATSGAISGTADLTVNTAVLISIAVTPATTSVIKGLTREFVATGSYDNGSTADLSSSVIWASSDDLIATVDASGLSTGVAVGTATITASSGGAIPGTADLTVNAATLVSISVTGSTSINRGDTQTFSATGSYDNGDDVDITASVTWTSSDVLIATVNASGFSKGVAVGTAEITATSGVITGSVTLTVIGPIKVDEGDIATPLTLSASTALPYSGTVAAGFSFYEITGLTDATPYTIRAAIDTTGDVELSVWIADPAGVWDQALTTCYQVDLTTSAAESCVITTMGTSVWVMVNGQSATPSDFVLNAVEVVPAIPYTIGAGFVSYDVQSPVYVEIPVNAASTYTIKWDDAFQGSGAYLGDAKVSAHYADTTEIFVNVDSGYGVEAGQEAPQTFTATQTGAVTITLEPYNSNYKGTVGLEVTSP